MKKLILVVLSLLLFGCTSTETKTVCTLRNSLGELETLEYTHIGDELLKLTQKAEATFDILGLEESEAQAYIDEFNMNLEKNVDTNELSKGFSLKLVKTDTSIIMVQEFDFSLIDFNTMGNYVVEKDGKKYISFNKFNEEDKLNGYQCE